MLTGAEWSVREQLAVAAIDMGKTRAAQVRLLPWAKLLKPMYAQIQIDVLDRRFPKSPRLTILRGMLDEVKGDIEKATRIYGGLIQNDETNVVSRLGHPRNRFELS